MSRSFLTPINLNQLELQYLRLHNLAVSPASPLPGQIYFDTETNFTLLWNGSSWVNSQARADHTGTQLAATISDFTASVQAVLNGEQKTLVCTISGQTAAAEQLWTIPVVQPFSIPANCAGSSAIAGIGATADAVFTLSYNRAGTVVIIGTITWAGGGENSGGGDLTGAFATDAYAAVAGDRLSLTAPPDIDTTLANLGIVLLCNRTSTLPMFYPNNDGPNGHDKGNGATRKAAKRKS